MFVLLKKMKTILKYKNYTKLFWILIDLGFCLSVIFEDKENIIRLKIITLLCFFVLKFYMYFLIEIWITNNTEK